MENNSLYSHQNQKLGIPLLTFQTDNNINVPNKSCGCNDTNMEFIESNVCGGNQVRSIIITLMINYHMK